MAKVTCSVCGDECDSDFSVKKTVGDKRIWVCVECVFRRDLIFIEKTGLDLYGLKTEYEDFEIVGY